MLDREAYLKFRRPNDQCLLCGCSLPGAGRQATVLEVSDKDEAIRSDFCPACWEKSGDRAYFSYWVAKRVSAPTATERRLARSERNEAMWRLFAALHATGDEAYTAQLFLLAHLLLRFRVLNYKGRDGDGWLLFEHPHAGEAFRVADVPVDSVDFGPVMEQVERDAASHAAPKAEEGAE
ncbi:MAG: hypothetical protein SF028_00500 [Candidatus Sumerlaeia bacterium]|nr:hypothetical protein [Candidatus Sumerlaeia bacterium]